MLRPPISSPSYLTRNVSFNFFKNWGSKCDNSECAKPPSDPPSEKYVVEKSCCKSIFETWKPKIPELNCENYPTIQTSMMMPYKAKPCTAGMKFRDKTRCEIEEIAKQCQKINHPKWTHRCPPIPKDRIHGPLPPIKEALAQCRDSKGQVKKQPEVKSMRKKCDPKVPEGDWNADGYMN